MKLIDFSCKHEVWIRNEDGTLSRMDEPYFRAREIAGGTWQILSSGDYSYLVEGDEEALAIDSGYGAGNIREFMQTLTKKPVRCIANTHDHFDHTANNGYFELVYMAEATRPLATKPFPSFAGIDFPRDYPVKILEDGDYIPLKGRELQAFLIPDHAVGSLAFLDRKRRILFSGDEFFGDRKGLHNGLATWIKHLEKLEAVRDQFDVMCGGSDIMPAGKLDDYLASARYAMEHEGEKVEAQRHVEFQKQDGPVVYGRMEPHPEDMVHPEEKPLGPQDLRRVKYAGIVTVFDNNKKYE